MAILIQMLVVGPMNHILDKDPDPNTRRDTFEGVTDGEW